MAKVATQRRTPTRQAAKGAKNTARRAAQAAKPSAPPGAGKIARKIGGKALKAVGRRILRAGGNLVRDAAERTADAGKSALESSLSRRLPIQVSVDVAVPLEIAWDEWMAFESFTEGVHRIVDIERDGDQLFGTTAGPHSVDWEAEITDEREHQSFAWRSIDGTDCAGLITFHRLSDRLTRIELDLDVLPTGPTEMATLSLHIAHRRAEAELRRFKARVEFIDPDVYEPELRQNGGEPETEEEPQGTEDSND